MATEGTPAIEQEIKSYALRGGATVVGIASAALFDEYAPKGHRPEDILPGARSLVVVGGRSPAQGGWVSRNPQVMGVLEAHSGIYSTAARVAFGIQTKFREYALLVPPGDLGHVPWLSLKLAAELAGLGTRSMAASILLSPRHGLLYYAAAVTTMDLQPDAPLVEPVCPAGPCQKMWESRRSLPCLDACPMCLSGELEDGRIKWAEYRQINCRPRAQTTGVDAFLRTLHAIIEEEDKHKRKAMIYGSFFRRTVSSLGYSLQLQAQCYECMRPCPVNLQARRNWKRGKEV